MDPMVMRQASRDAAISALTSLSTAFTGDSAVQSTIYTMVQQINEFDIKPPPPPTGWLVI